MAAAYAALVSLMHTIEQIQHHPRPPISLDKQQADSLTDNITFLQGFLEGYSSGGSREEEELESRIANTAYAAEDIIESYTVDQIYEDFISDRFRRQCLPNVLERMDDIKRQLDRIKCLDEQSEDHPHRPQFSVPREYVDSITENITFLGCFLEDYCSGGIKEEEELETRIEDAAYAAEVDEIHAGATSDGKNVSLHDWNYNVRNAYLSEVVNHMNNIRIEVTVPMEIIKQKKGDHPHPPISLDERQVDSITQDITFLQHFLEGYSKEEDDFENSIADAAYRAENIIETHESIGSSSDDLYDQRLRDVMAPMADIKSEIKRIEKLREYYPRRRISLKKKQVDYITENITFLRHFLEDYSSGGSKEEEELESRIADAAEENVIESYEVDEIHARSTSPGENISFVNWNYKILQKDLHRVVQRMHYIREEVMVLMEIIKRKKGDHPHPQISLDKRQVDSITEDITFLQDFLEGYSSSSSKEEELESRVADAAYAAKYVIKSHIVDQIHAGSTSHGEKISCVDFYKGVQKVIQDMDLIKKDVMVIINQKTEAQDQLLRNSSTSTGSVRPASTAQNSTMVAFGDILNEVLDKLTGQQDDLQILPIVGMGGIGKTTLARNIYELLLDVKHFDILAWVTISQEYSQRKVLQVLCQESNVNMTKDLNQMSEDELGGTLRKHLWGRRYLIVMDDIWSIEALDEVRSFFPNNNNGSRIMITTRLSNLSFQSDGSHGFQMNFLDEDKSWELFCKNVFGKEDCPIEFEEIGKKITKTCRGLPLSIVVIGGLLKKSKMTQEYWEYTLENLSSLINLDNNNHCLRILHTSYKELPMHLKPCFMYMGVFSEDDEIRVSKLIKLWVAEGFLKSIDGESFEVLAKEFFKELVDRNLVLVHKMRWNGKVSICKIHDLLRDLCLREAQKQKFLCVLKNQHHNIPQGIDIERRICIHNARAVAYSPQILHALESTSLTRSLLLMGDVPKHSPPSSSRLLRVYTRVDKSPNHERESTSLEAILQQVNLRYLSVEGFYSFSKLPSSFSLLWNLQTLMVAGNCYSAPFEIWKMSQLRHAMFGGVDLLYPSNQEDYVLEHLQTLSTIFDFKCSEEVVKRIPNIKKLKLCYMGSRKEESANYCLDNLGHLHKLESLQIKLSYWLNLDFGPDILRDHLKKDLTLPLSLKKLTLYSTNLHWEDLTTKIGSLPLLEVLKLENGACIGPEWETVEGQFCSLKFLLIGFCDPLKCWMTESTHFPHLEHLTLDHLQLLEEIPLSVGDIPTLQLIKVYHCGNSAAESAKRIKEEQEELGNEDLKVEIPEDMDTCMVCSRRR